MTYTLVADGGSDRVLIPILTWSLRRRAQTIEPKWADRSRIPRQPDLVALLRVVPDLYPCDVLFVHRDAEGYDPALRRGEITAATEGIRAQSVPIVPVRMTEAWLLANDRSIRSAAGNPNGVMDLRLPEVRSLEKLPDPKGVLYDALRIASGLSQSRLRRFRPQDRVHNIPNYLDDYSHLENLSAFRSLQSDIDAVMDQIL